MCTPWPVTALSARVAAERSRTKGTRVKSKPQTDIPLNVETTIMATISGHPAKLVHIAKDIDGIFRSEGFQINIAELPRATSLEGIRPICIDVAVYTNARRVSNGLRQHLSHIKWLIESLAPNWHLLSQVFVSTRCYTNCAVVRGHTPE